MTSLDDRASLSGRTIDRVMKRCRVFQVDAFTRTPFTGNPAGVVLDADGLSDAVMQQIARELNNSETAFILGATAEDHDIRVRFFTPTCEVPSCGHATIAAHYVLARERQTDAALRMFCGAGILTVRAWRDEGDYRVEMTQLPPRFGGAVAVPLAERLLAAMGLRSDDLDPRCPIETVSTGHGKILVGVRDSAILNAIEPDLPALKALSPEIGMNGYHVFTLAPDDPAYLTECRMFAPAIGIAEDPVTGNGNGPLGAYLVAHGLIERSEFLSLQGRKMGRPGVARVSVDVEDGRAVGVRVSGDAVIVFATEIAMG